MKTNRYVKNFQVNPGFILSKNKTIRVIRIVQICISLQRNSSSNLTDQQRQQLDLITKYTSAHGNVGDSSSDQRALSKVDNVTSRKNKRSLSSIGESDLQRDESKRTKCTNLIEEVQLEPTTNHFDDEDDEELSILLDHRRAKRIHLNLSQTQIQHGNSSEQSFIRKRTARKSVNNHRHLTT